MSAVDHVAESNSIMDSVHDWQSEEGSTDATLLTASLDALRHATLAEQQRIANLIILANGARAEYGVTGEQATKQFFIDLNQQIREGLGLA